MIHFLLKHSIFNVIQSSFLTLHPTESALLRVSNDVLLSTDSGDCVLLLRLCVIIIFTLSCSL